MHLKPSRLRRRQYGPSIFSKPFFILHRSQETTDPQQEGYSSPQSPEEVRKPKSKSQTWNPVWLHTYLLSSIVSAFVAAIAALLLLLYLSKRDNGLVLHTTNHFSWTYGPTAVLTIFVALWRQIDYYCKALTPWDELHRGHVDARRSVLLDYKSPLQAVSLYMAAKNRHITVVITILGFMMLKLVALASTGLFFPDFIFLPSSEIGLQQTTQLDGALYNETDNQGLFDPSIVYTAFAVMSKGLPYANGTTSEMVYEQFKPSSSDLSLNGTVAARLRALVPRYHCESAPATVNLQPANVTDQHPEDTIQLLFPDCKLRGSGGKPAFALNPQTFVCPERQLSPLLQQIDCNDGPDNWQLLTLTDFRYNQNITNATGLNLGDPVAATSWSTAVRQVTSIACRSAFSIENVEVTYDFTTTPPAILAALLPGANSTSLGAFTGFDLGVLATSALSASADMFGNLVDNGNALDYPNVLFKMMAGLEGGTYEDLLDEAVMIKSAERVFQQIALQSVAKFLAGKTELEVPGTFHQKMERLQVSDLSAWLMLSGCVVMLFCALFVLWKHPRDVSPHDLETLSSTAMLVANSHEFKTVLRGVAGSGDKQLGEDLQDFEFHTQTPASDNESMLCLGLASAIGDRLSGRAVLSTSSRSTQISWWSPLTLKRPVLIITLVLPLFAIGALEALQQVSDQRQGLASVSSWSDLSITIFTRFLPALLMLMIATMINSLDFNIALLAPFDALRSGRGRRTDTAVTESSLGLPLPFVLWQSMKQRQWGPLSAASASLVGSLLTIVVSGLLTVDDVSTSAELSFTLAERFNTTWTNSAKNDSSAAVVASLTESLGLDYPLYTYSELALPSIDPVVEVNSTVNASQTLQISLPAMRSDLQCVRLPADMTNVSATYNSRIATAQVFVSARAPLPQQCLFGGVNGTADAIEFSNSFNLHGNSSYVGKILDLHVGPFDPILDSSFGELSPNTQPDNPAGCPSLAFIYGFADVDEPTRTTVVTLMCYQYIDQIQTRVSFRLPEFTIPSTQAPVVDESASVRLQSGLNQTAFQFRLQLHMDDEFSSFNQTPDSTSTLTAGSPPLDNFFQGVLFGREPLDQELLMSADEADVSQVFGAIRGFYRRYMAQAISSNMRVPIGSSNATVISGKVLNARVQPRIVQNRAAKLVLQAQLGLIFLLATLAVYFSTLRQLVPFNPSTIAGVSALFAWSRSCDLGDSSGAHIIGAGGSELGITGQGFALRWWEIQQGGDGSTSSWYGIDAVVKDGEK